MNSFYFEVLISTFFESSVDTKICQEISSSSFVVAKIICKFAFQNIGRVAEWLGRGLQNLVQRFESARDLKKHPVGCFFFVFQPFIEVANPLLTSNKGKKKTPAFAGVFFVQFQASLLLALHLFL